MSTVSVLKPTSVDALAQTQTYERKKSVVFFKTKEEFGGLSNMCGGFKLLVNETVVRSSEALYQCCKFPDHPEIQTEILDQTSPMLAKNKIKQYEDPQNPSEFKRRADWDEVKVEVMGWCLRVKLVQYPDEFGGLLEKTGSREIVEESRKDSFWGAKKKGEDLLVGKNVLGKLLMELREEWKEKGREGFTKVEPLKIPRFKLLGERIGGVE